MDGADDAEVAIVARGACKRYGKKDSKLVLDHLDMTVNRGRIYGLLGASGCGKTTLLSAIVGSRGIQAGDIRIFGRRPGNSLVKSIGYMPQDIALVGEFTVKGALQHYGWIFGMSDEAIDERHLFLERLLDLPPADKYVKNLSGGQQRRVSLAVVLVHDPQILILDEPTVGLDPVLRENIWNYLVKIAVEEKKTIIITTHYIEEARQAHTIGLMRNGKILSEGEPSFLLSKYGCTTLEDVFLLLSRKQKEGHMSQRNSQLSGNDLQEITTDVASSIPRVSERDPGCTDEDRTPSPEPKAPTPSLWQRLCFTNAGHAKALLSKNFLRLIRHPGGLAFSFGFPCLQICIFFLVVGIPLRDIPIGVVNEELGNFTDCADYAMHNPIGGFLEGESEPRSVCRYRGLGCKFIQLISDKIEVKQYFKTREEAHYAAATGLIRLYLYFPSNYSEAVTLIKDGTREISDSDLDIQEIGVYREGVDYIVSMDSEKELYETYQRFAKTLAKDCNDSEHMAELPIMFNDPVYGRKDMTYNDYMAPGVLITLGVFLAMSVSTLIIITERTEGVWERTTVAGVSPTEILIFHTITQSVIVFFQVAELFVISFTVFQLYCEGSKLVVFLILYLQGIVGVAGGILISIVSRTVTESNYLSLGSFYPFVIMSGCIWPLEGMPTVVRYLAYLVPTTLSVESLVYVFHRGWSIANFQVFKSVITSTTWIAVFSILSAVFLRIEKS